MWIVGFGDQVWKRHCASRAQRCVQAHGSDLSGMELTQRELSVAAPSLRAMSREPSSSFRGDGRREGSRWTRAEAQGPTEAGGGGRRGDGWAGFVILPGIVPQGCAGPSSGLRGRLVGTFGGV